MIKDHYQKELTIAATQQKDSTNNNKKDVRKIQSWLTLFAKWNPGAGTTTGIDGDFGTATEKAVQNFQNIQGLTQTGIVDQPLFDLLCASIKTAFETPLTGNNLRQLVVEAAMNHLQNHPFELVIGNQSNSGPWVRSYMNSNEGNSWLWCMGFVQTIIDQAASSQGKDFRSLFPITFSCDSVGIIALQKGLLSRFTQVRNNPSLVKPGDIFLLQKSPQDWIHTGIITQVGDDFFETIEGNTNEGGSTNGIEVSKRTRNYQKSKLDVVSIEPLV